MATSHPSVPIFSQRCRCALWLVVASLAMPAGCDKQSGSGPSRPLIVVIAGDTSGWIVPCGCTSNQSGGLLRRGTYVEQLRRAADVVVADVGGAPSDVSPYNRTRFESILQGEKLMGLSVHNIGLGEARLGADYLRDASNRLDVPLISANLRDAAGRSVAPSSRIVNRGGRRLVFIGVLSDRYRIADMTIEPPRQAILAALTEVKGQFDDAIVLAYLPEEELAELASQLPEVDLIVGGPTGQSIAPRRAGPTLWASATNKGKFLGRFLAPAVDSSHTWQGEIVEMTESFADNARQKQNLDHFYRVLAKRDYPASDTPFVKPLPQDLPPGFRIAGFAACRTCHQDDCDLWDDSAHADAWESLQETGAQVDSYCQQCHSTGFGLPGGFESLSRSTSLALVGCESCHGPSHGHMQDSKIPTAYFGQAKHRCAGCHDRENSPQFEYEEYWALIEHGEQPTRIPGDNATNKTRKDGP